MVCKPPTLSVLYPSPLPVHSTFPFTASRVRAPWQSSRWFVQTTRACHLDRLQGPWHPIRPTLSPTSSPAHSAVHSQRPHRQCFRTRKHCLRSCHPLLHLLRQSKSRSIPTPFRRFFHSHAIGILQSFPCRRTLQSSRPPGCCRLAGRRP